MLKIKCDKCNKPLKEAGALVFGPPIIKFYTRKFHICKGCWVKLQIFINKNLEG